MSVGLENVVAAETRLSSVDGANGVLVIRGYALDQIAGHKPFEEVARLLFTGLFDDLPDAGALAARLGRAREEAFALVPHIDESILALPPMDGMRALIARIHDGEDIETALRLLAAPAVLLPAILRRRRGLSPLPPAPGNSHGADMLHMLTGKMPAPEVAGALDTYLVTVADHGLNASTFAARVVASTWSGLTSSVLAGLAALKGQLHGGAPGPIIAMLDGIGRPEKAEAWIEAALMRGDRLMGFGHRIYKVRDPRADALKAAVRRMSDGSTVLPGRLMLAEAVEAAALRILQAHKPDRPLDVNVEFYTALLLEALGFPPDAFTAVFATGRTAGWLAHAREQRLTGRLIRPQSVYVGPEPAKAA
jgi:citrate synthase